MTSFFIVWVLLSSSPIETMKPESQWHVTGRSQRKKIWFAPPTRFAVAIRFVRKPKK